MIDGALEATRVKIQKRNQKTVRRINYNYDTWNHRPCDAPEPRFKTAQNRQAECNLPRAPTLPPQHDLRIIVSYSLLSGLCPLIPIPFLDDWARDLLRSRLASKLAASCRATVTEAQAKVLATGIQPTTARGCAGGCLKTLIVRPFMFVTTVIFRKVMRKILFFLTVKDTVDTFSQTFHENFMLRRAFELGLFDEAHSEKTAEIDPALASRHLEVRRTIERVYRSADTRPVTSLVRSLFKSSRRTLAKTARRMTGILRRGRRDSERQISRSLEHQGEESLGNLIDDLTRGLETREGYLETLSTRLESELALAGLTPQGQPTEPH